jgi:hypothetical protein
VVSDLEGLYEERDRTTSFVKYFQLEIIFAALGAATIGIVVSAGNEHSVSLWQWSSIP